MKIKTIELVHSYIKSNKIIFNEDLNVDLSLSASEISELLFLEFGKVDSSLFNEKLTELFSDIVKVAIKEIKEKS